MNILERKSLINMNIELLRYVKDVEKIESVFRYLNKLNKLPINYYIPNEAIATLYNISVDPKLSSNPIQRFKVQDNLLQQYGFKPLASGTNRRAFYNVKDPEIVLKIASDMIGRSDNISEYQVQSILMPFCTKIFSVDQTGVVSLSERVEPMTEKDYKEIWLDEIFDTLQNFYDLGYMFDDVGLYSFKNLGIRMGFGPVLLDFPYVYKIDWNKLRCERINPHTHEKCGGRIGYNYSAAMSEIICYKCGIRYTAKSLINQLYSKSLNLGRNLNMSRKFNADIPIKVVQGNQVIIDTSQPEQPQYVISEIKQQPPQVSQPKKQEVSDDVTRVPFPFPNPQKPPVPQPLMNYYPSPSPMQEMMMNSGMYRNPFYDAPRQYPIFPPKYPDVEVPRDVVEANGQKLVTVTPEEYLALREQYKTNNNMSLPLTIVAPPEIKENMLRNQETPKHSTPIKTIGTVKEFEHYYVTDKNGESKRLFYYPKNLKNEIISWLKKLEETYGKDIALMFANRLEIEYIPKEEWNATKNNVKESKPAVKEVVPNQQPKVSSPYTTVNTINRVPQNNIVIAPPTKPSQLKVEDPAYWDSMKQSFNSDNEVSSNQIVTNTPENRPTTGLHVMKPMTQEELDAQDQNNRAEQGILGFLATSAVETAKFNDTVSRIKTIVEQRFNNFQLIADSEKQAFQLANNISKFIAPDVKHLMNDDGNGLVVVAKRTVDHQNKDCYSIEATNYKTPLFKTLLYPLNTQVNNTQDDYMTDVSTAELTQFFEAALKKFDSTKFNGLDQVKKGLICFLCDAAHNMFKNRRLTVPAALKEATAYVNQVVNFTASKEEPQKTTNTNTTIADTL